MINSTTEDKTMEDLDAIVMATANNPTDNIVANQNDILMVVDIDSDIRRKKLGSVLLY